MPTVNLTNGELGVLAGALQVALKADEDKGLEASLGLTEYEAMSGEKRRAILDLWAKITALRAEHV